MSERYVRVAIPRDCYEVYRYFAECQGHSTTQEMRRALMDRGLMILADFPHIKTHLLAWNEARRQALRDSDEVPF